MHPALGRELAHPGVDERHAGVSGLPGFPVGLVGLPLHEGEFEVLREVHGGVRGGEGGLAIELAEDELAHVRVDAWFGRGFGEIGGVGVLFDEGDKDLADGENASGEVGGEAGGAVFGGVGAGFGVLGEVLGEEVVEAVDGGGVPDGPEFADAVPIRGGGEFFFFGGGGDGGAIEELCDLLLGGGAVLGGRWDGVEEGRVFLDCG